MTSITVVGAGNIGAAVAGIAVAAGAHVQVVARDVAKAAVLPGVVASPFGDALTGDIVVLALPYDALADVVTTYGGALDGKIVVDVTNPLDFSTFDSLVVPQGSSAAAQLQAQLPAAHVLKAFNTNFAATLASGKVGELDTTVLVAGDDATAKDALLTLVRDGGLRAEDVGSLARAHELEALGFLQLTLAAGEKTSWTTGFALGR